MNSYLSKILITGLLLSIVAPACGQLLMSALFVNVVLLATCIIAVIAWQRRSVPTAVFITL